MRDFIKRDLVCEVCGKQDETVAKIFCGYCLDLYGEEVEETICDDCEYEHCMGI